MKKHLLASILFVFACTSQAADFKTSAGDITNLYEGQTQGDEASENWSKFYNNNLSIICSSADGAGGSYPNYILPVSHFIQI